MTPEQIARCPVHNEFYRIYPECWNTVNIALDGDKTLWVPSFYRSARKRSFSAEEKRTLAILASHIARAAEARHIFSTQASTLSSDGIVAAYDALDDGIVMFDRFGCVLHMNLSARKLAEAMDGIMVRDGFLLASDRDCRKPLATLMSGTLRVAAGEAYEIPCPIGLRRQTTPHPLLVRAYVSPNGTDATRIGVLKLQDHHTGWALPSPEMVQTATGLSAAEARLAISLLEGLSVADHADRAGVTEHTVRSQLKNIRGKLMVSRQADIVAAIARLCRG
jgi:DNA-binding CsgD family transcriptional regulator/PAS domain-containing protein